MESGSDGSSARGGAGGALVALMHRWEGSDQELRLLLYGGYRRLELMEGEYHFASHWDPGTAPSALPEIHYVALAPFNARLTVGFLLSLLSGGEP